MGDYRSGSPMFAIERKDIEMDFQNLRGHLYSSWTNSGKLRPLLLLANPAILESPSYCPIPNRFLPESDNFTPQDNERSDVGDTLFPLLSNVNVIGHIAHADLSKLDFDRALDAVSDIESEWPQDGKNQSRRFSYIIHGLLRIQLLDELRWARETLSVPVQFSDCDKDGSEKPPNPAVESPEQVSSTVLGDYYSAGILNYLETAKAISQLLLTEIPNANEPSADQRTSDNLLSLLWMVHRSNHDRHISTVVLNICGAALGLLALLTVCISYNRLGHVQTNEYAC